VDKAFLVKLYEDVGLPADQAERVAMETLARILRRERPRGSEGGRKRSLVDFLVRDPLVSMNRIIGKGDVGLPFYDDELRKLSVVAFSNVMSDVGIDPVVALAYAKVVVEAFEPGDLYGPVWAGLGREGPLDLDELRRMDWSPLRDKLQVGEPTATQVTAVMQSQHTPQAQNKPAAMPTTNPAQPARGTVQRRPTQQPFPKPKK
jgi:hypothetical protein